MKPNIFQLLGCIALAFSVSGAAAQAEPMTAMRMAPDELQWGPSPTGNPRAYIAGDEKKSGMYIYRIRFPANAKVQPHFHPDERIITVLSGTLYVGYGDRFDESAMKALPPGSVWTEPAKQAHFAWAKDGEAVIQVIGGNGPSGVTQVEQK
jgi:quercetin dioxygenase-like cupin family protein